MGRERKGAIVERIKNPKTKREGVLRMEKGSFMFFCRLPDEELTAENSHSREYFESKDAAEVKSWIQERIKKSEKKHRLDWKPVIQVDFDRPDTGGRRRRDDEQREIRISAEMTRFYVALSQDRTQWLKLDWDNVDPSSATALDEDDRLSHAENFRKGPAAKKEESYYSRTVKPFTLPLIEGDRSYVAFTEELWAGLNEVMDTLERSAVTLVEMLGTKKGLAAIADVGAGLKRLGSGSIAPQQQEGE